MKSNYHIPTKYFLSILLLLFTQHGLLSYRFPQENYLRSTHYTHLNYTSSQNFHDFSTLTVIGKLHVSEVHHCVIYSILHFVLGDKHSVSKHLQLVFFHGSVRSIQYY